MHSIPLNPLSPDVCVAPQLHPESMQAAVEAGFKSVINNRPDYEAGPEQPTSAVLEEAAREAGLQYAWLPVHPMLQTPEEVARFAELLQTLPKPVLVFCRSGARSTKLYRAAVQLQS